MYALRERRVHVTQEDFEMAVAKVCITVCLNSVFCPPTYTISSIFKDGAQVHLTSFFPM